MSDPTGGSDSSEGARDTGDDGRSDVPYPPAPWRSRGEMSLGLLPARHRQAVPADLRPLGSTTRLGIGLVRYREGTLSYDELMLGTLVRRGHRAGLLIKRIWVSDPASMWGGRGIWRVPKEMAEFSWTDGSVTIHDGDGLLAGVTLRPGRVRIPAVPLMAPGFGGSVDERLFIPGRLVGTVRRQTLEITAWSDRLPPLKRPRTRIAVAVRPFRMTVPGPVHC